MLTSQRIGFGLAFLTLALIPIQLDYAIWSGGLLALYSLVLCAMNRFRMPALHSKDQQLIGGAFALYFLWHIVALSWTGDVVEGWASISRKWFFVLIPLAFLLADWSWLTQDRVRKLLYGFLLSLVGLFLFRLGVGCHRCLSQDASWHNMLFSTLDPVHHNYMSLYLLFAIAFCYTELVRQPFRWQRHLGLTLCILLLTVFLVLKNSRGGLLCYGVLSLVCWCDLVFRKRHWKMGILLMVAAIGLFLAAKSLLPESQQRMENTVETLAEGKGDIRLDIYRSSLRCIAERPLLGHGTGYVNQAVYAQFEASGIADRDRNAQLNSHDIYLQSWVAGGVLGFLFLLALLGAPLAVAFRRRNYLLAMLVLIYAVSGLVESLFERQMAILFYCLLIHLLIQYHPSSPQPKQ